MASLTLVDTGAVDHDGVGLPETLPRSEAARCAGYHVAVVTPLPPSEAQATARDELSVAAGQTLRRRFWASWWPWPKD